MKRLKPVVILTLILFTSFQQKYDFDLEKIEFNGMKFRANKLAITKRFGSGSIIRTNHECGFFVNDQTTQYYQLVYTGFNFIGDDRHDFYLQSVDFELNERMVMRYGNQKINAKTTMDEFVKTFGGTATKLSGNEVVFLRNKGTDDGARFIFRNGKLVRFEYWTPC